MTSKKDKCNCNDDNCNDHDKCNSNDKCKSRSPFGDDKLERQLPPLRLAGLQDSYSVAIKRDGGYVFVVEDAVHGGG
jgi:hypothetical protein